MKKQKLLLYLICFVSVACSPAFVPIVHTYGYNKPTEFAAIVKEVPSNNASKATHVLQKKAARAGARYVIITKMVNTNNGYWWEKDWGEGFLIEAELYY